MGNQVRLTEYLNSIYDSDDLHEYKYGKIDTEFQNLSATEKEKLELILDIIRLNEDYRKNDNIFSQYNSIRLPEITSITKEKIKPLLSLNVAEFPLAIRARISDFIWTTVKDPVDAKIAIQSYLELYDTTWDEEHWPDCINAIYRAVNIASSIGKKGNEYKECLEAVRKGLERTKGNDHLFLSSSLLEILAEQKIKVGTDILQYARNAIEAAKNDSNLSKAQNVLETLAMLDRENRNKYYEEAGDISQDLAFNPAIRRVYILNQALQYYQKAGNDEKKLKCREKIEEAQSHILEEMHVIKTDPIDISSTVYKVQAAIRETKSFAQAIISFGDLVHIYSREELLKHVREEGVFASLFPSTRVDSNGRQMYSLPSLPLDKAQNIDDNDVQLHMWDKARWLQEMNSDIVLKYGISELNKQYQYSEEDLDFLVEHNAIIPEGREKIIRKGIFFGLQGDLYVAMHILLPQMENIIRALVKICGGKSYYIKECGDVEDHGIGPLLKDPNLNDCYDPDIIFHLKGLLDQPEGSNLRNLVAHGILEPGNSLIELYFLGFFIKFLSWYSMGCLEERTRMKTELKNTNK